MIIYELLCQLDGFGFVTAMQIEATFNMAVWPDDVRAKFLHVSPQIGGWEMQAIPAHGMRFQFAALCRAAGRAELQPACRGLPCVTVLPARTGSHLNDIFDWQKLAPWRSPKRERSGASYHRYVAGRAVTRDNVPFGRKLLIDRGRLLVPLELPFSPMGIFALGIEQALDMAVRGLHDPDPRHHRRTAYRLRPNQLKPVGFAAAFKTFSPAVWRSINPGFPDLAQ